MSDSRAEEKKPETLADVLKSFNVYSAIDTHDERQAARLHKCDSLNVSILEAIHSNPIYFSAIEKKFGDRLVPEGINFLKELYLASQLENPTEQLKAIVVRFVNEGSPDQINIDGPVRQALTNNDHPKPEDFIVAAKTIITQAHNDVLMPLHDDALDKLVSALAAGKLVAEYDKKFKDYQAQVDNLKQHLHTHEHINAHGDSALTESVKLAKKMHKKLEERYSEASKRYGELSKVDMTAYSSSDIAAHRKHFEDFVKGTQQELVKLCVTNHTKLHNIIREHNLPRTASREFSISEIVALQAESDRAATPGRERAVSESKHLALSRADSATVIKAEHAKTDMRVIAELQAVLAGYGMANQNEIKDSVQHRILSEAVEGAIGESASKLHRMTLKESHRSRLHVKTDHESTSKKQTSSTKSLIDILSAEGAEQPHSAASQSSQSSTSSPVTASTSGSSASPPASAAEDMTPNTAQPTRRPAEGHGRRAEVMPHPVPHERGSADASFSVSDEQKKDSPQRSKSDADVRPPSPRKS